MTHTIMTQTELIEQLRDRFGDDPMNWAFQCPRCKDVASAADFKEALDARPSTRRNGEPTMASDLLGQECIGRTLGALRRSDKKYTGRGCDWAAYGLFRGPVEIKMADGRDSMWCFPVAPAPVPAVAR